VIFDDSKPKPVGEWVDPVKPGPAPIKLPAGSTASVTASAPDGKAALEAYAARLRARYAEVEAIFANDSYNPLPSKDFKRFMVDQAAENAMRYIQTGQATPLDEVVASVIAAAKTPDAKAEVLRKQGFAVSGDAKALAEVKADDGEATKPVDPTETAKAALLAAKQEESEREQIGNLVLLDTPFGRMATEMGFDPNGQDDDE
jgi:hypothetical protein